jgi:hypothetical protein
MEHSYKSIQTDNYALREYVIQLQSRLLDLQVELPQPPPNVNLPPPTASSSRPVQHAPTSIPEPPPSTSSAGSLADVAAAVAGLRASEASAERYAKFKAEAGESIRGDDDVRRLREPLPPPSSCE